MVGANGANSLISAKKNPSVPHLVRVYINYGMLELVNMFYLGKERMSLKE